jgi:hypothetical protein
MMTLPAALLPGTFHGSQSAPGYFDFFEKLGFIEAAATVRFRFDCRFTRGVQLGRQWQPNFSPPTWVHS